MGQGGLKTGVAPLEELVLQTVGSVRRAQDRKALGGLQERQHGAGEGVSNASELSCVQVARFATFTDEWDE
jgi:hypothetical protein